LDGCAGFCDQAAAQQGWGCWGGLLVDAKADDPHAGGIHRRLATRHSPCQLGYIQVHSLPY
jgi:hypothetical protein